MKSENTVMDKYWKKDNESINVIQTNQQRE